jgi:hypothetical protein
LSNSKISESYNFMKHASIFIQSMPLVYTICALSSVRVFFMKPSSIFYKFLSYYPLTFTTSVTVWILWSSGICTLLDWKNNKCYLNCCLLFVTTLCSQISLHYHAPHQLQQQCMPLLNLPLILFIFCRFVWIIAKLIIIKLQ